MEGKMTKQGKIIDSVNVLDLRRATEASVAEISRIENANIVLYSRETAGLAARLDMGHVNNYLEVPPEAKAITGQVVFNRDYFKRQEAPLSLVVLGQVLIEADVPVEDIERGLGELYLTGQLICPEHLAGTVQSKIPSLLGSTVSYAPSGRVTLGSLVLDENHLRALDDGSELVVIGSLRLPKPLPNDLLERKIQRLQVIGGIRCHEENAQTIRARLVDGSGRLSVIPASFELVAKPLIVDNALLESLPASKLYCLERVQVAPDVEPSLLDDALEGLISKDMVICPVGLRGVMARKCNLLETQAVFYEGELWLEDDVASLPASRFDYLEGQATLLVTGALQIDPDVAPRVLAERLHKVHNLGAISCTPEQMGAIQARLGLAEGVLETGQTKTGEEQMASANCLVL